MKLFSLVIVLLLCSVAFTPGGGDSLCVDDASVALQKLNICGSSSSGGDGLDLPYLLTGPCALERDQVVVFQSIIPVPAKPIQIAFHDERPPKSLA
jgi:hypothetical protein